MDLPPVDSSGRRTSDKGTRGRGASRLGLKRARSPTPSSSPSPASSTALPQNPTVLPVPVPAASNPARGVPTALGGSPRPPQAGGWASIPPKVTGVQGNLEGPNSWGIPLEGFFNFMQQPYYPPGENFHLIGQTMGFNPMSQSPSSACGTTPDAAKQGTSSNDPVNIDTDQVANNESNRPVKKRFWTPEEEERLASSWLNASKDPIKGNDKNGDTFWKEVTQEFNRKGNGKRTREMNQLKIPWTRLKTSISDFNGLWTKVIQVNTSGYSDDMLEEEAQKMYVAKFGKRFSLVHWWKKLKDEPKWCAQFEKSEKNKNETIDVPNEQERPIGREAAKTERSGKRNKKNNIMEGIVILGDNIEKIIKVQEDRKVEREKVTDAQIQISNTNLKAAKEQKEAKMFEVYNSLLNQDISQMSEAQMASRERAIIKIEEKLFSD